MLKDIYVNMLNIYRHLLAYILFILYVAKYVKRIACDLLFCSKYCIYYVNWMPERQQIRTRTANWMKSGYVVYYHDSTHTRDN